ncbi:MAG TPA: DUF1844 domain-containing protein [Pyrinomonadaceae bacterium]
MSEEKPTFKFTDRRLFNADGTPREDVREEREAELAAQAAATSAAAPPAPPPPTARAPEAPPQQTRPAAPSTGEPATAADSARGAVPGPGAMPSEEDDPQEFLMVVEFVASFAAEALGMSTHPEAAGQAHVNLPLARQCIDMLATLERKTQGNLSAEEKRFLDLILSQLRMHYVQLTQQRPAGGAAPRGFSGSDITGGR